VDADEKSEKSLEKNGQANKMAVRFAAGGAVSGKA